MKKWFANVAGILVLIITVAILIIALRVWIANSNLPEAVKYWLIFS